MTGTRAVSQLTDGVLDVRSPNLLVRPRLVVARVAARTVSLKCGEPPGNEFRVGLVTIGAWQVGAVIERLVGQSGVSEVRRNPRVGVVAHVAFLCRQEMTCILPGRANTVMTGRTGPQNLIVIDSDDW